MNAAWKQNYLYPAIYLTSDLSATLYEENLQAYNITPRSNLIYCVL